MNKTVFIPYTNIFECVKMDWLENNIGEVNVGWWLDNYDDGWAVRFANAEDLTAFKLRFGL